MKPAFTLGIALAAISTGGCTKYLRIETAQSQTSVQGAPLRGVPYSLYFDQFKIVTSAKLVNCNPFTLEITASTGDPTALPDPALSFMIDPNSMSGLLHSSKFDIAYNPDGSIASVNAEVEDHTPAVVLGLAKAAAGAITLGASGPFKALSTGEWSKTPVPICTKAALAALNDFADKSAAADKAKTALDKAQVDFDTWNEQMDDAGDNPPPALRRKFSDSYIRLRGAVARLETAQAKMDKAEKELIVSDSHLWPESGIIGKTPEVANDLLAQKARTAFVNPDATLPKENEAKLKFHFAFELAPTGSSPYSAYPAASNIPINVGRTGLPYRLAARGQLTVTRIGESESEDILVQPVVARQLGRVMILPCTGRPLVKTGCSLNFDKAGSLTKAGTSVDGAAGEKIADVLGGVVDAAGAPVKAMRDRDERKRTAAADAKQERLDALKLDQDIADAEQAKRDAVGEQDKNRAQEEIDALDRQRTLLEARRKLKEEQDKLTVPTQ